MGTLLQDLRYGLRMLAKAPGFTLVAVMILAIGIGGNAMVFSWIRAVLVNPLPGIADSSRVVAAETVMPSGEYHTSSYPDYRDYRDQNSVFSGLVGFEMMPVDMSVGNEAMPERTWGFIVTGNYFDVLGVNPAMGRTFHAEDDKALNSAPYIVLSHSLWIRRFGADPHVVGRTIRINAHPFTVVGVAPRDFVGTVAGVLGDFWVPMMMQPEILGGENLEERTPTFVHMMGRLKPGVSVAAAQAQMSTLARHLAAEYPLTDRNVRVAVLPVWKAHYGVQDFLRSVLTFLMIVAVAVLLIACVNVANLLLARATSRAKEIAIRAALGATRGRLIRQLLIESLLLAVAGGVGGIFLALWGAGLLAFFFPPAHFPVGLTLGVDGPVLAFTLLVCLVTGLIFGLAPALRISRTDLNEPLKETGRTTGSSAGSRRLRDILCAFEMVLATVLLIGAGLLVRSLHNAEAASPGFQPENVALAAFDLQAASYSDEKASIYFDQLLARVRGLPGVESASLEQYVPLWFYGRGASHVDIEGYTPKPNEYMGIEFNVVGPEYFHTLEIPLVQGRDFSEQDRPGAPKSVIINQTMANRFWPQQSAVGHHIHLWGDWRTVVGVARDIKYHRMNEPPESFVYLPSLQAGSTDANLLVRSRGSSSALLGAIRWEAKSLDPRVQPLETDNLSDLLRVSLFANRMAASLATILGALGMLLAALGIYGVLSYTISQRVREIGIRMALGAQSADILQLVIGQGLRLAVAGAAAGAVISLILTRWMTTLLFGVSPTDPTTFAIVILLVTGVSVLAAYIPARRAMRMDPMVALRYE